MTNEQQVLDNIALIHQILKRYPINENDREDLISTGTIGLLKAVNTYKEDKGVLFATYAYRCIDNEIKMYLRKHLSKNKNMEVSLYTTTYHRNGDELFLIDTISDNIDWEDICITEIQIDTLLNTLSRLSDRECKVIRWKYGIGCVPRTQQEIANSLGVSQSYISRYTTRILRKLKRYLKNF